MKHLTIFILCSLLFALTSCKPKQKITEAVNTSLIESTYIHDKLTPVSLPVDSLHIKALFECDSTNKVILKQLFEVKSNNINTAFNYKDGLLDYTIKTGGDTVYILGTNFYYQITKILKLTITLQKTVKVEKKLTILQKLEIASGKLFLLLLGIGLIYIIVKYLIKLKIN